MLDEAQMVGSGFSSIGLMASRLTAQHRWAVTGTPIGPGGLDDIAGLFKVLRYAPLDDATVFKGVIRNSYMAAAASGSSDADGLRVLAAALRPVMWRNTKASAAEDHPLPPRRLQVMVYHTLQL